MNSISRLDHLIAQLHTQLRRQANRSASAGESAKDGGAMFGSTVHDTGRMSAVGRVQALRRAGVSDERQLVRCLLEGLLNEEFGDGASNDVEFQDTVTMVCEVLEDDPTSWALCQSLAANDAAI